MLRLQISCDLEAALTRQEQIDQRDMHTLFTGQLNGAETITGGYNVVTSSQDNQFDCIAKIRVILDHKHGSRS